MKKHHTLITLAIVAVFGYIVYMILSKKQPSNSSSPFQSLNNYTPGAINNLPFPQFTPSANSGFTQPYLGTTPGYTDNLSIYFGQSGKPFQSTINVNVTPNSFNSLFQKFIPLYGFVGMTAA